MGLAGDVGALVGAKVGVDILSNSVSKNAPKWKKGIKGWRGESARHSMSRYGIKTGRTKSGIVMVGRPKQVNAILKLEKKVQNNSWKKEIDARIKKGNGFEEISDNILSKYPHLDNYKGREQIEKYYNKKYAKSDVQAGWF